MFYECLIYDDRTNINERINKCAVSYCPNVPWILTKKRFQESQKTKVNKKIKRKLNRIGHKVYHFMTYSQERIIKLCDDDCMTNHLVWQRDVGKAKVRQEIKSGQVEVLKSDCKKENREYR